MAWAQLEPIGPEGPSRPLGQRQEAGRLVLGFTFAICNSAPRIDLSCSVEIDGIAC